MLYEMLTGHKPFDGENPVAIALKHMQDDLVMPREIMPSIPEALEEIVIHAMEKEPTARYQSAADMIRDIDTFKLNQSVVFGYKNGAAPINSDYYGDDYDDYYDDRYNDRYDDRYDDYEDEEDEDDEPPKKRSYIVPILLAVTVAVVIMASVIICITVFKSLGGSNGLHTSSVEIPNFVGMSIVDIEQEYKDKLQFETTNENNNEYESGIVFWQADTPGKTVKEGYTCTLKVSKGKQMTTIPDVTNREKGVADSELKAAGFVTVLSSEFNDDVPKGYVTRTEPSAGSEFHVGGTVKIFISDGPFDTQVKVPKVEGLTQEKAIDLLKENKLNPVVKEIGHEGDKGLVITQSVKENTRVSRGSDVIIYVSKGEVDESTLAIKIPIPDGARGSYSVIVYNNAKIVGTAPMDKAETVAGSNFEVSVKGKKNMTFTVHVRNNQTGKTVEPYVVYDVDFEKKTATIVRGPYTDKFIEITPTTTAETTKKTTADTEPSVTKDTQDTSDTKDTNTDNPGDNGN
jgi:serine/threonine-protein kinase